MSEGLDLFARLDAGWSDWSGGSCPVSDETVVQVKYRPLHPSITPNPSTPAPARWFKIGSDWWRHESPNRTNDIIAYRVVERAAA
jgi:hypothetical protein